MANNTELLKQLLSKDALAGISKVTGVDGDEVTKILGAALPQLMSGAEKETAEKKDDFVVALADHAKKDTTNMNSFFNGVDLAAGAKIIGHLLGNTDKTAEAVAKKAGVTKAKSKSVLSAVAPLFMSLLGKQSNAGSNKQTSIFSTLTSALGIKGLDDVIGSILGDDKKKTDTAAKKKTDTKKKTSTTAKKETAKKTDTKKKATTTAAKKKTSTTAAKKETAKKTDTKKKTSTTSAAKKKTTSTAKKKTSTTVDKKKTSTASTKKTDTKKKTSTTAAKKTDTKKKTTTTAAKKKTSTTTAKKKTSATTAAKKKTSSKKSNEIDLGDVVTGLLGKIVK